MGFTRRITILSLTLSMLGLGQSTLAHPVWDNSISREGTECPGGISEQISLGGQVVNKRTFTLSDLESLPASEVPVSYLTRLGQETYTYVGVPLWKLIEAAGGLKPNPDPTVMNASIRQYIFIEATNCYQVIVAVGEVDPDYENKQVLIAYATKDEQSGDLQLLGDKGIARLVVPGDKRGGRYIFNIRRIQVLSVTNPRFRP